MFWFLRLWLAHLLADFPFQTNFIFKLKKKSFLGVVLHGSIFLICALFLSMPYLKYFSSILYILCVWIFHIYIDWRKVKTSNLSKTQDNIWYFLLDQLIHFISLTFVFLFPYSKYPIFWERPYLGNLWLRFYNSDYYVLLAIGYIIVVFTGTILTFYVRKNIDSKEEFTTNGIPSLEKYIGGIFKSILFFILWFEIRNYYSFISLTILIKFLIEKYLIKISSKLFIIDTLVDISLIIFVISMLKLIL
ncbi:MAG: DUF3307 domain-containing protein [Dictyoglomus sp.]|nr:DUF3307 domain-containing protein [Dictyoglomus sp.]MCX7942220.1 DUF3307 domain-containing protein [Dictyoglomaceae bacterium]MDW8188683.1 DUF3307 domain-containing protein [Dictyoglomus sp.]